MTDKNLIRAPFRMAMRHEGEFWNAYFAKEGTMDGALLMGSIRMTLVADQASRKEWQACMTQMFSRLVESKFGAVPTMLLEPAPEHERSGHA